MGGILGEVPILQVLLEEVPRPFREVNDLLGVPKVAHSERKHLQLLFSEDGDHVAARSAAWLAYVCNGMPHGILVSHFGNVLGIVPPFHEEFDGCRIAGIAAKLNGIGDLAPKLVVLRLAVVT